jgi:hypothetical protein
MPIKRNSWMKDSASTAKKRDIEPIDAQRNPYSNSASKLAPIVSTLFSAQTA